MDNPVLIVAWLGFGRFCVEGGFGGSALGEWGGGEVVGGWEMGG